MKQVSICIGGPLAGQPPPKHAISFEVFIHQEAIPARAGLDRLFPTHAEDLQMIAGMVGRHAYRRVYWQTSDEALTLLWLHESLTKETAFQELIDAYVALVKATTPTDAHPGDDPRRDPNDMTFLHPALRKGLPPR